MRRKAVSVVVHVSQFSFPFFDLQEHIAFLYPVLITGEKGLSLEKEELDHDSGVHEACKDQWTIHILSIKLYKEHNAYDHFNGRK